MAGTEGGMQGGFVAAEHRLGTDSVDIVMVSLREDDVGGERDGVGKGPENVFNRYITARFNVQTAEIPDPSIDGYRAVFPEGVGGEFGDLGFFGNRAFDV